MNKQDDVKVVNLPVKEKLVLLTALGCTVDKEGYVINATTKERILDRYTEDPVKVENATILPGSTVIIDTNSFSLSEYFEEYR